MNALDQRRIIIWAFEASVAAIVLMVAVHALRDPRGSAEVQDQATAELPARLAARGQRVERIIVCRTEPLAFSSRNDLRDCVSDEDAVAVMRLALPQWNPPTVPSLIHELKLWGVNADFTVDMIGNERTGSFIVETLLSDELCRRNTTPNGGAFLLDSPYGIRVVLSSTEDAVANRAESHFGQLAKALAESGIPSTKTVSTFSGSQGTVADIVQDAALRYSIESEVEFIAVALARWLPPQRSWENRFGEKFSFDHLAERLIATPHGVGACGGCHIPYAVATIPFVRSSRRATKGMSHPIRSCHDPKDRRRAPDSVTGVEKQGRKSSPESDGGFRSERVSGGWLGPQLGVRGE